MTVNKNSFYEMEVRTLFCKYNVELNEELIKELAAWIAVKSRAAEGANTAVNQFIARFETKNWTEGEEILQELYVLCKEIYGIVWQSSLEK